MLLGLTFLSVKSPAKSCLVPCAFAVMSLPSAKLGGCNIVTAWESTYPLLVCSWGWALLCIFFYRCLSCIYSCCTFSPLILFWAAKSIQLDQGCVFFVFFFTTRLVHLVLFSLLFCLLGFLFKTFSEIWHHFRFTHNPWGLQLI